MASELAVVGGSFISQFLRQCHETFTTSNTLELRRRRRNLGKLNGREGERYLFQITREARISRGLSPREEPGQKTHGAGVSSQLVCEWVGGSFVVKNQGLKSTQNAPV
ncbi:hypothetical protein Q5P01_023446 [Channa striata]|uniref:Uncharacterized protein n=1 Tax=Channa striata TaxID=64152 RepID=A0AA88LQF8_CHASR|nr:hypothetical protein Q5P01_023446 [Channa striata]